MTTPTSFHPSSIHEPLIRPLMGDALAFPELLTKEPPFEHRLISLPGGPTVGVGGWSVIEIRVPCILQPTWGPDDVGFITPVDHRFDQNFFPQIFYTRDLSLVDPQVGVANQNALLHVTRGPGTIYFRKPGTYYVNNQNAFPISALLVDASEQQAWAWMEKRGTTVLTVTATPPSNAGAAGNFSPWNWKACQFEIYNDGATMFYVAAGRTPVSTTLGVPCTAAQKVVSLCPWALHTIMSSTAGALANAARGLYQEV